MAIIDPIEKVEGGADKFEGCKVPPDFDRDPCAQRKSGECRQTWDQGHQWDYEVVGRLWVLHSVLGDRVEEDDHGNDGRPDQANQPQGPGIAPRKREHKG